MSLDETHVALRRFAAELESFHQTLHASMRQLDERHAEIAPLWRDASRQDYDTAIQALQEQVTRYTRQDAPRLQQFLRQKIAQLDQYLHGGR